jgi:DNA-binding NarL/FixJ family response regulator
MIPAGKTSARALQISLTRRERALVSAILKGHSNRAIAAQFGLSQQTVRNQLRTVFRKFGVRTRLELAIAALRAGFCEFPGS